MKAVFLLAGVLFSLLAANAQGGLLNKVKNKVKGQHEATEKTADNNTTGQTVSGYNGISQEEYIRALGKKNSGMGELKYLRGTNELAINQYYDHAKETDMANFYAVMQKKGRPSGDGANDYDEILGMRTNYPALYEKDFRPLVNATIDGAYQLKKTNISEAVKNLKLAIRFNDACLMVIPDMQSALASKEELEKALTAIGGAQANVFTSEFHKKTVGKILFSKEPIVAGKEDPAQFITSFSGSDYIYGIAYLDAPISQIAKTIDGDKIYGGAFRMNLDGSVQPLIPLEFRHVSTDWDKSYFLIEVRPDPSKAMHREDAIYFATRFADFSPRKHTVSIQLGSYQSSEDFAIGEFKLDWSTGNADKMMADAKLAASRAEQNHAKTVQLDPAFTKPNYVFKDPALSVSHLKKAFMAGMPQAVQILKMITIKENASEDWTINRNDYGVIINKSTNHFTSFVYKAKDGNCYIHQVAQFLKVSTGSSGYGNLVMNATGMQAERIACENVK